MNASMAVVPIAVAAYAMASWHDVARRIIPDHVPLVIAAAGISNLVLLGDFYHALLTFLVAGGAFVALAPLCMAGAMGGGDVKLITASLLLVGVSSSLDFVLFMSVSGGILCAVYLAARFLLKRLPGLARTVRSSPAKRSGPFRFGQIWHLECRRILRFDSVPYGLAISGGGLLALFTPVM